MAIGDDPDMILAAKISLEKAGHKVSSAGNGEAGLRQLKADWPDLVIRDVMRDSAIEGFQRALRLRSPQAGSERSTFKDMPILMLTVIHGTTPLRFRPDRDHLPVEEFIEKPIDPKVLVAKVEALRRGQ